MVRSRRSARASLVPPRSRAPTVGESLLEQRTGGVGMLASGAPSIDVPPSIDGSTRTLLSVDSLPGFDALPALASARERRRR